MSTATADLEAIATRRQAVRGLAFTGPAVLYTLAFFATPLAVILIASLYASDAGRLGGDPGFGNYARFFARDSLLVALTNSVRLAAITTVVSLALAYPLAYVLAFRVPARWQRLGIVLAVLPFWTSYVVRSYAWLLVLAPEGVVNGTLMALGLIDTPLRIAYSDAATVIGFVHFFVMLLTLTIFSSLVQINPRYLLAAADMGAGPWTAFFRVLLPLSLPGVVSGAFMTFVLAIGDYVTPAILGGSKSLVLPQAMFFQISRNGDFAMASAMAVVLMAVMAIAYLAAARWLRMDRV
ncbi:ABC transporter permease [Zavarzinia sp.]|uniref:ABC transporter permease n=1 Tax=Zavarzinia sp. TaxID=2027920 RepID=UPI003565BE37